MMYQERYPAPSSGSNSLLTISKLSHKLLCYPLCLEIPAPQQVTDMVKKCKTMFANNTLIHYIAQSYDK